MVTHIIKAQFNVVDVARNAMVSTSLYIYEEQ